MSLLNRKEAAREIGIDDKALDQFEALNPEVIKAAGVKVPYKGSYSIRYRRGALRAWLDESAFGAERRAS